MLHLDTNNTDSSFRSLLAFKPRQVLIAQRNPTTTTMVTSKITPEMKGNLHQLILDYLHRNGFSKTLKRFRSEAQIQADAWKPTSLHLEVMFCKHNTCDADSNKNTSNKPVSGNDEAMEEEKSRTTNAETSTKRKKKKAIVETNDGAAKDQLEVIDKKMKESSKNPGQILEDIIVNELDTKSKKKKTKHDLVSSIEDPLTKKIKDKKKKNTEEVKLESSATNGSELVSEVAQKEIKKKKKPSTDENETIQPDETRKAKKSSKKRKRSFSDKNENENGSTRGEIKAQEASNTQFDGETNGKLEIDRVKSKKKQRNVTSEPKTVNAFQRVKIDEVEFAHDKLQDNSYWAKDGAEIGYGARAQEVLGQVRGRDFRHEKTKKKRGSYRGGLTNNHTQ